MRPSAVSRSPAIFEAWPSPTAMAAHKTTQVANASWSLVVGEGVSGFRRSRTPVARHAFRRYYNNTRPHRALGRRTPRAAYDARPKATPRLQPLHDAHYRVRHDTIDRYGKLTLRHASRLHHIGIGRRHAGAKVLVLVKDLHIRITTTNAEPIRELTLDPTRNYQPQPKT
jgi:hypothetical protein